MYKTSLQLDIWFISCQNGWEWSIQCSKMVKNERLDVLFLQNNAPCPSYPPTNQITGYLVTTPEVTTPTPRKCTVHTAPSTSAGTRRSSTWAPPQYGACWWTSGSPVSTGQTWTPPWPSIGILRVSWLTVETALLQLKDHVLSQATAIYVRFSPVCRVGESYVDSEPWFNTMRTWLLSINSMC